MARRGKRSEPEPERLVPRPLPAAEPPRGAGPEESGSLLSEQDLYLFHEGTHFNLHEHLGAHPATVRGERGTIFGVWAPNAERVSVVGDFDGWDARAHPLARRGESGVWEGFVPGVGRGALYKFHVESRYRRYRVDKTDPLAFFRQTPPETASVVWELDYAWNDAKWMAERKARNALDAPISIYEMHVGSWRRVAEEDHRSLGYRELADRLVPYLVERGFTHVEFMPLCEHPFYGSWGYQTTGYFAPTSRYGTPQDLMFLIDRLHQAGIGAILDWVPSHFPTDEHGLSYFDGTHLYEHEDARKGFHPDWQSYIFNYDRPEVRSFLISSALYWLSKYHFDGLRIDAVASMLYLDYSRKEGEWIPNEHGGRENLEAIEFLRRLNQEVYAAHPDVQTIAEESTSWPMVSRPLYVGGLGFGLKWDMGWMHDTLQYFSRDPLFRSHHHREVTFRSLYAFHENFLLPLSHDEVVYGKGSLIGKMPGDEWRSFANLRILLAYQYAQPGKKLLFMGAEIAQRREWNHDGALDWHLLDEEAHAGIQRLVTDLNHVYRDEPELHQRDADARGFEWIDADDNENSVISFLRKDAQGNAVVALFNMTPMVRRNYRVGVPKGGTWRELLNTDAAQYGGSGQGNLGWIEASPVPCHGRPHSLALTLPPLAALLLKREPDPPPLPPERGKARPKA